METLRRPGRPLSFDREGALHQAMLLFWRHGYEGTTLGALTAAMGIMPRSLYAAFGDKRRLFLEAVRRYLAGDVTLERIIGGAPSAREAAEGLLQAAAASFTGDATPAGCLLAHAAISCSLAAADVKAGWRRCVGASWIDCGGGSQPRPLRASCRPRPTRRRWPGT